MNGFKVYSCAVWIIVDAHGRYESYLAAISPYCQKVDKRGAHHRLGNVRGTQQEIRVARARLAGEFRAKMHAQQQNGWQRNIMN